jgi:hypothetical protein
MVSLENCQDYNFPPCRTWLEKAVCELGGQVVYEPEEGHRLNEFGPVTYRLLVAAYVADLRPSPDDPVFKSRLCDPRCAKDERCIDARCVANVPCAESETTPIPANKEEATKCMD